MEQIKNLKAGIKYKETPVGKIPVDWDLVRLGDICNVIGGSTPSTNRKEFWGGDISFATPTDITKLDGREIKDTEQRITPEGLSSCGTNLLPVGTILLTSRATLGACAINKKPMATNQGFANLVCKERAYNWFIFYKMASLKNELQKLGSGSTFKEVSKKSIKGIAFSLPPLTEQKKIAEILTTVDEAIEKTAQIIEKIKEAKKGVMRRLLTRGIGHKKFKKAEIGEIPETWGIVRLGDICEVIGGSTPSTSRKEFWGGDIPFVTPTDITKLRGRKISDTEQKITREGLSSCGTKLLPVGTVLLTSRATIGASAINTKPMATNQGFANLVCNERAYNWFVFYKMASLKHELEKMGSGSTFKEISKRSIKALIFSLPPLSEQKKIT
ncbi:MAG: restriction endonuclease subunit S, partial [Thermodesulfobacteriota bacterium]|nr:restriction endonuclease subunit S [Thermodesulfobacteriota bacterium]